jgi:hypothetical protein
MGLMQLLTVGRSLGRISDEPSRYRMAQQSLLPKFGSVNALEQRVRGLSEKTNPVFVKTEVKKPEIATATNDRKNMNADQPSSQVTTAPNAAAPRPAFPRGRWSLFKNPFSKSPRPTASTTPVQSELSLDAVKPVRNDLRDADMEGAQAARRQVEAVAPAVSASAQAAPAPEPVAADGAAWNKIKNQFFGAGKA